jgi:hypothetical protein
MHLQWNSDGIDKLLGGYRKTENNYSTEVNITTGARSQTKDVS